jgi:hypothetical protein
MKILDPLGLQHAVVLTVWLCTFRVFANNINPFVQNYTLNTSLHGMVTKSGMLDVRKWHADYHEARQTTYKAWASTQGVDLSVPQLSGHGHHAFSPILCPSPCMIYVNDR